jgi:hypothetical protein
MYLCPLFLCFLYFAQLATGQIKKYVKRGVDLSAKNKLGDTPLHEVKYGLALRRRGKRIEARSSVPGSNETTFGLIN